jgi:hypothetical protein
VGHTKTIMYKQKKNRAVTIIRIRMDLGEIGSEDVEWVQLAQDRGQ